MKVGPVVPNKLFSVAFALFLLLGWLFYRYEQNRPYREFVDAFRQVEEERCRFLLRENMQEEYDRVCQEKPNE